jgi:hypothetical protein
MKPPRIDEIAAAFPDLEVEGFLGAGGMGCVYRVRENASGRLSALKVLPRELAADPAFAERFDREARTLSRLQHPNIVGIHRFGQSGGFCYLLMEHVDGANLRQALRAGKFTPEQALSLIPHLCDALQYAHGQGVLHRDIKPENILLDAEGRVKIADFGIAKIVGEPGTAADDFTLTRTGARLGTPHYMAPEQVERPEAVDHRADIYSLGVVFYELLTGELPLGRFQAPSAKATLDARVDEIVFRALAKERELRQQSAGQVKEEVEGLGAGRGGFLNERNPGKGRTLLLGAGLVWASTWLVIALNTRSWAMGLTESIRVLPVLLLVAVIFGLIQRTQGLGPGWRRLTTLGGAVVLSAMALGLYPRSALPRFSGRGLVRAQATQNLSRLGLQIRLAAKPSALGPVQPVDFGVMPAELLLDPRTGQPFEFLAAGQTNASLSDILVASPPQPGGARDVLLGDGSVQRVTEERFREWTRAFDERQEHARGTYLLGPSIAPNEAEQMLAQGGTVSHSEAEGYHRLNIDLADAFGRTASGQFDPVVAGLFSFLRWAAWNPEREVVFPVKRGLKPGTRPDLHEKTEIRHGGLLAILAVFAAKTGNAEALSWAQQRGGSLWAGQEGLLLCERRLDAESDQDWEVVQMKTADVLALRPGSPTPMTVTRYFKHGGKSPVNRQVDFAWPRQP